MIVVIFLLILVILLAQFAIICAKRELTETETSPLPPGSSSSSAQAVKGSVDKISDEKISTQISLETAPAYFEEHDVFELAGELPERTAASTVGTQSASERSAQHMAKIAEKYPPEKGEEHSGAKRTTTGDVEDGAVVVERAVPPPREISPKSSKVGQKAREPSPEQSSDLPRRSALLHERSADIWESFKKLEETQPDLVDYTSLMADPVVDMAEIEKNPPEVGSLGDLLVQLNRAKAARIRNENNEVGRAMPNEEQSGRTKIPDKTSLRVPTSIPVPIKISVKETPSKKFPAVVASKRGINKQNLSSVVGSQKSKSKKSQTSSKLTKQASESLRKNVSSRKSQKKSPSSKRKSTNKKKGK
ncbi:hypothetical protein RB195_004293 [Necator americanus]|uniref:Uncharacterized protein n=1 Tax=Necator americanus TaxID=51031 RepID=A0ABR1BL00_NECAM